MAVRRGRREDDAEGKEFFAPARSASTASPGSGADWLERYKPFIEDGKTVVVSPHKVYGPQTQRPRLQLRKRRIDKVILAGMMANLCVESHLRELLEQGFEVAVVKDATAAPRHPEAGRRLQGGGHQLRLPGERGPDDGRRREGHEVGIVRLIACLESRENNKEQARQIL